MTSDISALFPGIVVQASLVEAITAWVAERGAVTAAAVPLILALAGYPPELPPYPSGMVRFPDSNSSPDGFSIVDPDPDRG